MYRIFLVEDEEDLSGILEAYLAKEGWSVTAFRDGPSARAAIRERPDLWILDIMLPGGVDGYRLLREIRADRPALPVIFISARDADIDRIVGLELGSDDYLSKPFLPRELVLRARKLLERTGGMAGDGAGGQPRESRIPFQGYVVDPDARAAFDGEGRPIELTSKEFELLRYLADHAGQVLAREQLLDAVWGSDYFGSDRAVDDLVRRLRKRLPSLRVETVYGYGYRAAK